ncbi:MAG: ATP synthase F0 subunit C [Candidatus Gracilibacteria bacterium]|jgi:F-type H+-transporting ATPase subunit c
MDAEIMKMLAAALVMGIGSLCPAIGEGMVASKALEGMSRNPEMGDKLFTNMIVAMAIIESIAIYCFVIALIILFVS